MSINPSTTTNEKGKVTTIIESNESTTITLNQGIPFVEPPKSLVWFQSLLNYVLIHCVFGLLLPIIGVVALLRKKVRWSDIVTIFNQVHNADKSPITNLHGYQDSIRLSALWKKTSAKPYIHQNALEYQLREGYCSLATLRCTLHSFSNFPKNLIPKQKEQFSGPSNPDKWLLTIQDLLQKDNNNEQTKISVDIFRGDDVSYEMFVNVIRKSLEDDKSRVVVNYLRPVLFGFNKKPFHWLPANFLLSLMGGHFSPVVGMLKDDAHDKNDVTDNNDGPLIAVFDVNHTYDGAYLVPAKRLYESIKSLDLTTGKSRAIMIIKMHSK